MTVELIDRIERSINLPGLGDLLKIARALRISVWEIHSEHFERIVEIHDNLFHLKARNVDGDAWVSYVDGWKPATDPVADSSQSKSFSSPFIVTWREKGIDSRQSLDALQSKIQNEIENMGALHPKSCATERD